MQETREHKSARVLSTTNEDDQSQSANPIKLVTDVGDQRSMELGSQKVEEDGGSIQRLAEQTSIIDSKNKVISFYVLRLVQLTSAPCVCTKSPR